MTSKTWSWIVPLFATVACSQNPTPITTNATLNTKVLGTVSLGVGTKSAAPSVRFSDRVALPDNAITVGIPTFVDFVDTNTSTRYLSAKFPITNNTLTAFDNLTFYAYNKNGVSVGGTAIQNLVNFVGGSTSSNAQSLLPIHKTNAGIPNPVIDATAADFQGFAAIEASDIKADALGQAIITNADTVLQYGFVARNGNSRTIPAGGAGTVTIAYKLPNANVNAAYKFVANFVLANEALTRVTRGLGDSTSAADARATTFGADEVYLAGSDNDLPNAAFAPIRVKNLLISTNPVCLLSGTCSTTPTLALTGAATVPINTLYTLGIVAEPSAGSELTDIEVDWNNNNINVDLLLGNTTSATHTFTTAANPNTIMVIATDSSTAAGTIVITTKNIVIQ
jgi:hypothetical protein